MFSKLDDFLIDRVAQPLVDRLAERTTPNALGRSLIIGSAVFFMGYVFYDVQAGTFRGLDLFFSALTVPLLLLMAKDVGKPQPLGALPASRLKHRFLRLVLFCGLIVLLSTDVLDVLIQNGMPEWRVAMRLSLALEAAGFYAAACRRNPPKRRQEVRIGAAQPQGTI